MSADANRSVSSGLTLRHAGMDPGNWVLSQNSADFLDRVLPFWRIGGIFAALMALGPTAQAASLDDPLGLELAFMRPDLRILEVRGIRGPGDDTFRAIVDDPDRGRIEIKLAAAAPGGGTFNNEPRYEVAAYRLQKLFLEPDEYVVPPTVVRAFELATYREFDTGVRPTFSRASGSVLAVIQAWLSNVSAPARLPAAEEGTRYAGHLGNLNILTFLIRHSDSNRGNFLISEDKADPRVFAVDNGIAFGRKRSDRGDYWRRLNVDALPAKTVRRLREISRDQLIHTLGVVAEFRIDGDRLEPAATGDNLLPGRGVRILGERVQLGLTRREIAGVFQRLKQLLEKVDGGDFVLLEAD